MFATGVVAYGGLVNSLSSCLEIELWERIRCGYWPDNYDIRCTVIS